MGPCCPRFEHRFPTTAAKEIAWERLLRSRRNVQVLPCRTVRIKRLSKDIEAQMCSRADLRVERGCRVLAYLNSKKTNVCSLAKRHKTKELTRFRPRTSLIQVPTVGDCAISTTTGIRTLSADYI